MEPNSWEKTCYDRVAEMYKLIEYNEFNRKNIVGLIHELDVCNTDEFRRMQQEDKDLCKALESFESVQTSNLNWHNIELSPTNRINDIVTYFDVNTNVMMETNLTKETNIIQNSNKQFRDITDENQKETLGRQFRFGKDNDLSTIRQNSSYVTRSTHTSPFTINEAGRKLTTLINTTSKLLYNSDESSKKQTDSNTSKSVPSSLQFEQSNNVDKKESLSIQTISTMSPLTSFRCSQVSQLRKYSLMESDFDPLSGMSTLSDISGINTCEEQQNIFKNTESNKFEK